MKTVETLILTKNDFASVGCFKSEAYKAILGADLVIFMDNKEPVVIKNRFGTIDVKKAMKLI